MILDSVLMYILIKFNINVRHKSMTENSKTDEKVNDETVLSSSD